MQKKTNNRRKNEKNIKWSYMNFFGLSCHLDAIVNRLINWKSLVTRQLMFRFIQQASTHTRNYKTFWILKAFSASKSERNMLHDGKKKHTHERKKMVFNLNNVIHVWINKTTQHKAALCTRINMEWSLKRCRQSTKQS